METPEATLAIRVKPGSSRTKVGGAYPGPYGSAMIVAVNARPVDGAATEAAVHAVAKALTLKANQIRVASGHTSRDKLLVIADPPADFASRVDALMS